jgi:hypothetical protein
MAAAGHHLGNFGAVRLVRRTIQQQSDSAGKQIAIPGTEDDPLVAASRRQRAVPERIAACGCSGCMKLTDPPCATVSISISLSSFRVSSEARSARSRPSGWSRQLRSELWICGRFGHLRSTGRA